MTAKDFFHLELIAGAPISLIRYPLAILIKSPLAGLALISLFTYPYFMMSESDPGFGAESLTVADRIMDVIISLLLSMLELLILGRVFLVALLAERNEVLAAAIQSECRRALVELPDEVAPRSAVVAVLGMAHCNGVMKLLLRGPGDKE